MCWAGLAARDEGKTHVGAVDVRMVTEEGSSNGSVFDGMIRHGNMASAYCCVKTSREPSTCSGSDAHNMVAEASDTSKTEFVVGFLFLCMASLSRRSL